MNWWIWEGNKYVRLYLKTKRQQSPVPHSWSVITHFFMTQIFTALQIKISKQRDERRFKPLKKFVLWRGGESNIGGGLLASSKIDQVGCFGSLKPIWLHLLSAEIVAWVIGIWIFKCSKWIFSWYRFLKGGSFYSIMIWK